MKFLINISWPDPSGVFGVVFSRLNKKQLGQLRSGIPSFPEISFQAFWPLEGRKINEAVLLCHTVSFFWCFS